MRTIGYSQSSYPTVRNITNIPFTKYQMIKTYDVFKIPAYLSFKLFKKDISFFLNSHQDFGFNKCDLLHFFNAVSFGKTPWISTFETFIPRYGKVNPKLVAYAVKKMAGPYCKKLIAISECTKNIQFDYLKNNHPEFYDVITEKIVVIHPGQEMLFQSITEKYYSDSIVFTFVGSLFFLKGGMEILKVFDDYLSKGFNIKLNIVSNLAYGDGVSRSNKESYATALTLIEKHCEHITHYNNLPNASVLELLKNSHVSLLPTYADTYGYSVLEAKAAGCAVVTTDIRAMPEINDNLQGYVIEVPKDELGYAMLNTEEDYRLFSECVENGLKRILADILEKPEDIVAKGELALISIHENHNLRHKAELLETIYDACLE